MANFALIIRWTMMIDAYLIRLSPFMSRPYQKCFFLSTFTNTTSGKFDAALFSTKHQLQGKPTTKWPTPAGGFICPFCFRAAVSEWLAWALQVAFWLVRELNFAIADNIFFTSMYLWLCMYKLSNINVFRQHLLFLKKNNFTRDT